MVGRPGVEHHIQGFLNALAAAGGKPLEMGTPTIRVQAISKSSGGVSPTATISRALHFNPTWPDSES